MKHDSQCCGGFRLRSIGDALVLDERARHLLFELPRILCGFLFMAPFFVFLAPFVLPVEIVHMRRSPSANKMSSGEWVFTVLFLCLFGLFTAIGFFFAFSRTRVVAKEGRLLVGRTSFGVFERLKELALSTTTQVKVLGTRTGVFGGGQTFLVSIGSVSPVANLFSWPERETALKLANAIGSKVKLPVCDETRT